MPDPIEVLITLPFTDELVNRLSSVSPRLHIMVFKARKAEDIPTEVWEKAEILYTSRVLPILEQAPNLRWLQFHWTGIDHALDEPILRKPG